MRNNHHQNNFKLKLLFSVLIWLIFSALVYFTIFKTLNFSQLSHTIPMIVLSFFAFILSAYILKELLAFPRLNKLFCIIFVLTISYILLLSFYAFFRIYYSRPFILSSLILSFFLISWIFGLSNKGYRPRYLIIDPDNSERVQELSNYGIELIYELNSRNGRFDGIVIKDFSNLNQDVSKILIQEIYKGTPLYSLAELYASITGKVPLEAFRPELIRPTSIRLVYIFSKRLFELLMCVIMLIPASVVGLIVSLLIIIDDGLPIFFIQERIGYKGNIFGLIKFRTMVKNAESNGPAFASNNDHRITRVGKIIRKLRFDELPQLINIVKGDMSLIGPRPEQIPFEKRFEKEIPYYSLRHNIRPGLTGWAQLHGGYAANLEQTREKLEYDLYYIYNQSIFLELVIIFKTITVVFTGHGAI